MTVKTFTDLLFHGYSFWWTRDVVFFVLIVLLCLVIVVGMYVLPTTIGLDK